MTIQRSGDKEKSTAKKQHGKSPTKQTIAAKKKEYCTSLVTLVGNLTAAEENVKGLTRSYEFKKCSFIKTEKNYRIFRNLELQTGVELIQASAEIKTDVKDALTKNESLVKALKAICTAAKEAKTKFGELREAAGKLDASREDSCNKSQMIILGCSTSGDCHDSDKHQEGEQETKKTDGCKNACAILDHLVEIPESLSRDIDTVFNSSIEILGIQSFASIKTLEKFQQDFELNAKTFNDGLVAKMNSGKTAVDAAQKELIDATNLLTTAGFALYNSRNAVETADATKDYLCCPECKCLNDDDDECGCHDLDDNTDRLKNCKCKICDICQEVTSIYCEEKPSKNDCEH